MIRNLLLAAAFAAPLVAAEEPKAYREDDDAIELMKSLGIVAVRGTPTVAPPGQVIDGKRPDRVDIVRGAVANDPVIAIEFAGPATTDKVLASAATAIAGFKFLGRVSITNVPSFRQTKDLTVHVDGLGPITGDVAWGGNWFFLVNQHGQDLQLANVERLTEVSWRIRQAVNTVAPHVDHIELCTANRNFVLCPGKAYDRSPCGTGTSAKLACLAADGKLAPGELWRQESITGSVFEASYHPDGGGIRPTITGRAWVNAHGRLLLDPTDPFVHGIA